MTDYTPDSYVYVRQRQYGFTKGGLSRHILFTRNILFCTAWFGFDTNLNSAFLCHFDSPDSTKAIPDIIKEYTELFGHTDNMQSYLIGGIGQLSALRSFWTRKELYRQLAWDGNIKLPKNLGFAKHGIRTAVTIDANTSSFKIKSYTFENPFSNAGATSENMTKANHSM